MAICVLSKARQIENGMQDQNENPYVKNIVCNQGYANKSTYIELCPLIDT